MMILASRRALPVAALVSMALGGCNPAPPPLADGQVEELDRGSAALADRLQQQLQGELMAAMASSGPAGAIDVCAVRAPAIAAERSSESGATVRRTSLRNRNPQAAPSLAEAAVMAAWLQAPRTPDGKPRVAGLADPDGQRGAYLWMRAIPTGAQCLACHGPAEALAPDVREALAARYPADRATGFAEGDLRGAFAIRWPAGGWEAAR